MMSRPSESQTRYGPEVPSPQAHSRAFLSSCVRGDLACSHCGAFFLNQSSWRSFASQAGTKACNKADDPVELSNVELSALHAV
jgi:hypothetical protein